jgi:hypothetical protein
MSNDANPVHYTPPPLAARNTPLGNDLPTIFIPESIGVVVGIKGEGVMQKMSLSEAESRGFINVIEGRDNLFSVSSDMAIQIKSSRVRLALFPKPV